MTSIEVAVTGRRDDGSIVLEWDTPYRFGIVVLNADLGYQTATNHAKAPNRRGKWYVDGEADLPAGVLEACRAVVREGATQT